METDNLGLSLDGGTLQRIPPNASREEQIGVLNNVIDRLNDMLKVQVFSDSNSKRMLIGYQKDGWGTGQDFGIKISIPGINVAVATDEQLIFKMALTEWTWRTSDGVLIKQFDLVNGIDSYYNADGILVKRYNSDKVNDVYYDPNTGISQVLIGGAPDDGRMGNWTTKPGEDVITNLGG